MFNLQREGWAADSWCSTYPTPWRAWWAGACGTSNPPPFTLVVFLRSPRRLFRGLISGPFFKKQNKAIPQRTVHTHALCIKIAVQRANITSRIMGVNQLHATEFSYWCCLEISIPCKKRYPPTHKRGSWAKSLWECVFPNPAILFHWGELVC